MIASVYPDALETFDMAFHVRDKTTDALVRELATQRGLGLTEAVKVAVEAELGRLDDEVAGRMKRMAEVVDAVDRIPRTGLKADKAFFDELSGD